MRIALLNHYADQVGGLETYLFHLIPKLREDGYQPILISQHPSEGKPEILDGVGSTWCLKSLGKAKVLEKLDAWQPDFIWNHGFGDLEFLDAVTSNFPVVYSVHNYEGLCISGTKTHSFPDVSPCEAAFGSPCLWKFFPRRCGGRNPKTFLKDYRFHQQLRRRFQTFRAFITHTQWTTDVLRRNGISSEKIHPIIFGPPMEQQSLRPFPLTAPPKLLFLGRMVAAKGGETLLKALSYLRIPVELTFLGDGPKRPQWQQQAKAISHLGHRILFRGWVSGEEKSKQLQQSHLLILPSLWAEPFGLVGLEAGSVGVPTVAYDLGGIPTWLKDGINGHLASTQGNRAKNLAQAIQKALSSDFHFEALRQAAFQTAQSQSLGAHVAALKSIFRGLKDLNVQSNQGAL